MADRTTERPAWLTSLCLAGAAAMAVAAAYLLDPSWANLGVYIDARRYELTAYALAYSAVMLTAGLLIGEIRTGSPIVDLLASYVVGHLPLFMLGMLYGALAVTGIFFDHDPNVQLCLLLTTASAVCFIGAWTVEIRMRRHHQARADGKPLVGGAAAFALVTVVSLISLSAIVVFLAIGFQLFHLLKAGLFDGDIVHLERVAAAAPGTMFDIARDMAPLVVLLGLLMSVVIVLAALAPRLVAALTRTSSELTPEEVAYTERSAAAVTDYAERHGYPAKAKYAVWFSIASSLVLLVAVPFGLFWSISAIPRPYDPDALHALGWHVYESRIGASSVIAVFAAIFWAVLPNSILSRLWRRYSELSGWAALASKSAKFTPEGAIALSLRRGRLSLARGFDPGRFLHDFNLSFEAYFLFPAVFLTFVTAIVWHHDMSRYHLITDRHIEVMNYWTLEVRRFPFSAVRSVTLECAPGRRNKLEYSYEIELPDSYSVDVLGRGTFRAQFDKLRHVDDLVGPSVPRNFKILKPFLRAEKQAFNSSCIEALIADFSDEDAAAARKIFRIDDWERQRWRERTGSAR